MRSCARCHISRPRGVRNANRTATAPATIIRISSHQYPTSQSLTAFTTRVGSGSVLPESWSDASKFGTTTVISSTLTTTAIDSTMAG